MSYQRQKYGHLVMSFENHKWSENVPEAISEGLKFKYFLGACLQTPLEGMLLPALRLPKFSLSIILPPLSIFLNETLIIMCQMFDRERFTERHYISVVCSPTICLQAFIKGQGMFVEGHTI